MNSLQDSMKEYCRLAVDLRRRLHKNPEPSWEENKTQRTILDHLPAIFKKSSCAKTGVVADLIVDSQLPFLAFRADIDALRMEEVSDLPFRSKMPGISHACGHDCHTAALVVLAQMMEERMQQGLWNDAAHNIRLIFEPAEELPPGGALKMIGEGVLEGVEALIGFHLWSKAPTGMILIPEGDTMTNMAYSERLKVEIVGKGGHAARPDLAIDPVRVARKILDHLDKIRDSFSLDPCDPIIRSTLRDTSAVNVIPERCVVEATVRTTSDQVYQALRHRIPAGVQQLLSASNATGNIDFQVGYCPVNNNTQVTDKVRRLIIDSGLPTGPTPKLLGGESFGHFSFAVPSCFLMIGCGGTAEEVEKGDGPHCYMHHSGYFNPDEGCFQNMLAAQLSLAIGW